MKEKKSILGRGLSELFEAGHNVNAPNQEANELHVSILDIQPGKSQPRRVFDKEKIEQLANSIKDSGLLQPLLVRSSRDGNTTYELIAGERRWLAAQQAGLTTVPVIIRELDDRAALKVAIIENIQREDLNILEEAEGYQRLIKEHAYTQEMIAKEVGKSRSHVANTLRLLNLPDEIKEFLARGQISPGHARALITADNALEMVQQIIEGELNVREAEKKAQNKKNPPQAAISDHDMALLRAKIEEETNARASIQQKKEKLVVTLVFNNPWDLDTLLNRLSS